MPLHWDEKAPGVLPSFFKSDSDLDTPVVSGENNICPARFQRLLEVSSGPFYQVQSDLQT